MMFSWRISAVAVLLVSLLLAASCKKNDPYSGNSITKSSTALMNATSSPKSVTASLADVPVTGGKLNIQTAMISVGDLRIEENSGFDGEQQGEHNDGDQGGADNESGTKETDSPDILAAGPYTFDISNGEALIGSFDVYPGTFKKVTLTFMPVSDDLFTGHSIVCSGDFISDNGTVTPFSLKSGFNKQIQTTIANGGIVVPANASVQVNVVFNLSEWFGSLDFGAAQISSGQINIDASNNAGLLGLFEANLSKYIEVEEHE